MGYSTVFPPLITCSLVNLICHEFAFKYTKIVFNVLYFVFIVKSNPSLVLYSKVQLKLEMHILKHVYIIVICNRVLFDWSLLQKHDNI